MDQKVETLTADQIRVQLEPSIPEGMEHDDVLAGVLQALTPPSERIRPIEVGLNQPGKVYAWHDSDASAIKLAFDVLSKLGLAFVKGPVGVAELGVALKELVSFLIDLHRHRVRVEDPLQIKILLLLHRERTGMTAARIQHRLATAYATGQPTSLGEVEKALDSLANAVAASGPKPLTRADGPVWKSLV